MNQELTNHHGGKRILEMCHDLLETSRRPFQNVAGSITMVIYFAVNKLNCVGTLESTVEGDLASWIYLLDWIYLWSSFSFLPAPVTFQSHRVSHHRTVLMAQARFLPEVSLLALNHWHSRLILPSKNKITLDLTGLMELPTLALSWPPSAVLTIVFLKDCVHSTVWLMDLFST